MPRFVVLHHVTPAGYRQGAHWDLMLEDAGRLLTWSLDQPLASGSSLRATKLPDHRLAYLNYEGPVSENRGEVTRVDEGDFEWITRESERILVRLEGKSSQFEVEITRSDEGEEWTASVAPAKEE